MGEWDEFEDALDPTTPDRVAVWEMFAAVKDPRVGDVVTSGSDWFTVMEVTAERVVYEWNDGLRATRTRAAYENGFRNGTLVQRGAGK